jgi:glycosyltransferase involved in cell wall biosynthesis
MAAEITFAIPFYRDRDYLRIAVESVLAQRCEGWELLVSDDSGGGGDLEIESLLSDYRDDRIRYRANSSNLGMVANWNLCLDEADGDLVNLLHADDALLPNYADVMLEIASRHPEASAFFCETQIIDSEGAASRSAADLFKQLLIPSRHTDDDLVLEGARSVEDLMAGYFIMTPTLCYRKSRIGERRFSDAWKQAQDLVFIVELLMAGQQVVGSSERAYAYRRHPESATSLQSESMLRFEEEVRAFDLIADRCISLGWDGAARVSKRKRIIKLHLLYKAMRDLTRLRPSASLATLRYLADLIF